jgi:hypothetical protein
MSHDSTGTISVSTGRVERLGSTSIVTGLSNIGEYISIVSVIVSMVFCIVHSDAGMAHVSVIFSGIFGVSQRGWLGGFFSRARRVARVAPWIRP